MAAKYCLGKPLVAIGVGTFLFIATLVVSVAVISFRQIEFSTRAQARGDAYHRIEIVREQIVEIASTQPTASLEAVFDSHPQLHRLLARQVSGDEIYRHLTVVSASGLIVAREGPQGDAASATQPAGRFDSSADSRSRSYGEVTAVSADRRVLDYSVPINLGDRQLGAVCVGVSQDLLGLRIAGAHYPIRRVLVPLVLACLAVLSAGGGASWWLIRHARQMDRAVARQEHMAEVGQLANGLAHEIRNPLNAMRMQIAVIRKRVSSFDHPDVRVASTQLERLEHEVLRVQDLTKEFLAFGRPVSDNPDTIDLRALVSDIAEFIRAEFQQSGCRVVVNADEDPRRDLIVRMDRDKLRQVLLNLAENAREAMSAGGTLTIRLRGPTDREVEIEVCDTGAGIPRDRLSHIFEAFYSTKDEGSGLGLAIVKQIVEAAGGRISVRSEVGQGTCFAIRLPRVGRTRARRAGEEAR